MTTLITILCGICEAKHVTTRADHWCPECEEGLCSDCVDHHSLSRATRKHQIISVQDYKKLPAYIADISASCDEHGMQFTNFCQYHDKLCCPGCININHRKCEDLQPVENIIRNSKKSALVSIIEERLEEMLSFLDQGITLRKLNHSNLSEEKQNIMDYIKDIRSKINSHLETLEKSMMQKLNDSHTRASFDIQTTVNELTDKSKEVQELKNSLFSVQEYGSDLQAFFGMRQIDNKVNKVIKDLKCSTKDECCSQVKLTFTEESNCKVLDILSLTSFGEIVVDLGPQSPEYVFKTREDKEVQITTVIIPVAPNSIYDTKLELLSAFSIPKGKEDNSIWGCAVCPNGKMIFADRENRRLVFVNTDNSHDMDILTDAVERPFDVTVVDQKTIAVSSGKKIKIIDVASKEIKDKIKTENTCCGITCDKGLLLWCETYEGIKKMLLKDRVVSTILERKLRTSCFLEMYGNKVYFTDYLKKTVECLTLDGREEWQFKYSSVLNNPTCVAVDNNMFVYTTSAESDNVIVISPDGNKCKELLSSKDGMSIPKGICFDRRRNNLLVANRNGTAFLYHVDYKA